MKKKSNIILTILLSLLVINLVAFAISFNQLQFINNIIPIVVNSLLLIFIGGSIYIGYQTIMGYLKDKIVIVFIIIALLLNIILLVFNIFTNVFDNAMTKITSKDIVYSSTIIVLKDSNINSIDDLNNVRIGISSNENDYENYLLMHQVLEENNKLENNSFYRYDDYLRAINDLLNKNIDALVISSSYESLYGEYFEELDNSVKKITSNVELVVKNEKKEEKKNTSLPFTILIIGSDTLYGGFNADVQILMTVNPNTKKIVQVDVVRDTYAYNVGNNKMDKITHAGWYGAENVVATVSKLFDIKIDYYIKFNFNSVIDIVNMLGGINIEVPYRYLVFASKFYDGEKDYFINPGNQKLNGLETLMLARTRQAAGSNLQSRGRMQMKIIEEVTKQVDSNFILNHFFELFDVAQNNIQTNIEKQDMYYYLQKYINIKNDFTFDSNTLYGYNSSYYHEGIGQILYTYLPDQNSLNELSNKLKENLK